MAALLILGVLLCLMPSRCSRYVARNWGGSQTIELQAGRKLINITWKGDDLWYVTRPMTAEDTIETYEFHEDSAFEILQGTITIHERPIHERQKEKGR